MRARTNLLPLLGFAGVTIAFGIFIACASNNAKDDATTAKKAEIRASLFRTGASGTVEVAKATGLGQLLTTTVTAGGSYHVEIWIKPKHFGNLLGDQAASADTEYMWLITNPIRVK